MTSPASTRSLAFAALATLLWHAGFAADRVQGGAASGDSTASTLLAPDWGPQPGTVDWSVDGLTWRTEHLDLRLHPWFTVRGVSGTPSFRNDSVLAAPWDNLRGAAFEATLDGTLHVSGSLEEMQAVPGATSLFWMDDWSPRNHFNLLPGWGPSKVTTTHRVDAARARVRAQWDHALGTQDTLQAHVRFNSAPWGRGPQPLLFAENAPSFPHAGVAFQRGDAWSVEAFVARWLTKNFSPVSPTGNRFTRRVNASWGAVTVHASKSLTFAALVGGSHALPWTDESPEDSAFHWRSFAEARGTLRLERHEFNVSWSPRRGATGAWGWTPTPGVALDVWAAHITPQGDALVEPARTDVSYGGVPLGAALVPRWWTEDDDPWLWVGGSAHWTHGRWSAGISGRTGRGNAMVLGEMACNVLAAWPLSLSLGVEAWSFVEHPSAPLQGTRVRMGVSHTFLSEL